MDCTLNYALHLIVTSWQTVQKWHADQAVGAGGVGVVLKENTEIFLKTLMKVKINCSK
jgi:hypothetical protein